MSDTITHRVERRPWNLMVQHDEIGSVNFNVSRRLADDLNISHNGILELFVTCEIVKRLIRRVTLYSLNRQQNMFKIIRDAQMLASHNASASLKT